MKPPEKFSKIIDRKRYNTATATLIAGNDYWDGHNFERSGRNTFLYKTPNGAYFLVTLSQWQGERDSLTPIDINEAITYYEGNLSEHYVDYATAFPEVLVEDA